MAGADEAVAGKELVAEPGHAGRQRPTLGVSDGLAVFVQFAVDGVEP